jgi:hypothetical protein
MNYNNEIWKDYIIPYQISNYGRIRNKNTRKILKQTINKSDGYPKITSVHKINGKNVYTTIFIHKAVAEKFLSNPKKLPFVIHLDNNKLNNAVDNLRWGDKQLITNKNILYKTFNPKVGIDNNKSKLKEKDVKYIREYYLSGDKVFGARALGRKYGVSKDTILNIINNKSYYNVV